MTNQFSDVGDLTNLAKSIEMIIAQFFNIEERPTIGLVISLPPDYDTAHWVTNVSRQDGIKLFEEAATKMRRHQMSNRKSEIDTVLWPAQENPKSFDPALAEHLAELTDIAREIGAASITILRGATEAGLVYRLPGDAQFGPARQIPTFLAEMKELGATVTASASLDLPGSGTVMLIHFPASDGGPTGVESH